MLCYLNLKHEKRNNRWHGLYKCHCGKTFITDNAKVKAGKRKSCGCERVKFMKGPMQKYNNAKKLTPEQKTERLKLAIFRAYEHKCKKHNIEFGLDLDSFSTFYNQSCFYCGEYRCNNYEGFLYNGIDRIDSSRGYTRDNIVACCGQCNYQKLDYSAEDFIEKCKKIIRHRCPGMINEDYK